jgi:diadenosine tetraphosphate (Ap4A) HIT family hydrolase
MLPDGLVVAHTGRNGSDCTVTYPRIPFDVTAYEQRTRADSVDDHCFICSIVSGERDDHLVVFRDDVCIAFLAKFPTLFGYTLVAPLEHRTDVVGSFTEAEYVELQQRIHRVGRAVSASVPTERLYVLSLGSHQGNAHVHWHVAPLPPGVPYRRQQYAALMHETEGQLDVPPADLVALAERIAANVPRGS